MKYVSRPLICAIVGAFAGATIACDGASDAAAPAVPTTTITFEQLATVPLSPMVTVSAGMLAVDVVGDFDASCQMGPYPTADAAISGTTITITIADQSAVPCMEGRAALRYRLFVPVKGGGTYDVAVVHVNDAYRPKSPDAVTQAHLFVPAPD